MSLDWPKLVAQGRAKDIGVAWNDQEQEALTALIEHTGLARNVVAPYVRDGILTVEDYDAERAKATKGGKKTDHKTRKELVAEAAELGVDVNDDMTDATIAKLVKEAKANGGSGEPETGSEGEAAPDEEESETAPPAKATKGGKKGKK